MSKAVIGYWRRSVADSERIGTYDGKNATKVAPAEITAGRLPSPHFENLSEEANRSVRSKSTPQRKSASTEEESVRSISVLVAPLVATRMKESTRLGDYAVPVWIPATLMEDGTLQRREKTKPWVPRNHLDGGGDGDQEMAIIGSFEELETRKLELGEPGEHWSDYLKYGKDLLPDSWREKLKTQGYAISADMSLIKQDNGAGVSTPLLKLYDHILEGKASIPALLEKFSSTTASTPLPPLGSTELFKESSRLHLGHVSPYHLSRSQRESVLAALTLEHGEVLAVNGPPGTGKTTLLHAFWSSQWVAAAERGELSPLTVVASANNQAIANVLESLGKDIAAKRWLPSIKAFGLFIASQSQQEKLGAGTEWIGGTGFTVAGDVFGKYFTEDFIDQAREALMRKARRFFALYNRSIPQDVGEAVNCLRQVLVDTCQHYRALIASAETHTTLVAQIEEMCPEGEASAISGLQHEVKEAEHHAALWDRFSVSWDAHLASLPFWRELLSFLSPVRAVRDAADRAALATMSPDRRGLEVALQDGGRMAVGKKARSLHDEFKSKQGEAEMRLKRIQETTAAIALIRKELKLKLRRWNPETTTDVFSEKGSLAVGDVARRRLLRLAVHYWEARWLSEATPMAEGAWRGSAKKAEKAWASLAMLFPCIVTTIYTGPRAFAHYGSQSEKDVPLYGIIDTLILDEAGQITPDTVGPMMALAKRALVVGDTEQLRPIPGVYKAIDYDNSVAFGVCADANDFARHLDSGVSAFSGSAMLLAQRATARSVGTGAPGMFLAEHRRCVDPIIAICNELSYDGAIIPERGTGTKAGIRPEYPFPHIGYAHIQGVEIQTPSGSRMNEIEADTIAQWISDNQETILSYYGKTDIDDCVAVATPFKAQGQKIAAALRLHDIYLSKCSTIHSLQGAEKPIVIFSSVHTKAGNSGSMFDRDREMLNVAISRAKDSFLVFGDMGKFDPSGSSRSSVLARHLFASPDNEIPVMVVRKKLAAVASVNLNILRSVEEHREFLNSCFTLAKERLVIISPWIGKHGVEKDHVMESIRECVGRGVRVDIYADRANMQKATYQAKAAARSLVDAGASVIEVANIHQKSIYVDLALMSEGSFNWLSASREDDKSGGPRRMLRDITTVLSGAGVERELTESLAFLDSQN